MTFLTDTPTNTRFSTGKGFAIIYILFGVTAVGNVLTEIANKVIDHQHAAAIESILTRKIKVHEFKDFDLDGNGTIERTEYVLRKMILVGLVDQSDILRVEKEFDLMDLDGSGGERSEERSRPVAFVLTRDAEQR